MPKYDYDVIVIGAGAAGLTASTMAGQSAAKTLLIEKEEKLGGDCLHYGCVPSKSLIKSAYAYNIIKNSEKYGLPKVEVPPVDFANVSARIKGIIDTIQAHDEPDYIKEKYNVETRFGEAKFVDAHTIELNGEKITSRFFVLACGSSPFIPPIEGIADVPFITNMDIFTLPQLPESMIILGGGPIGSEMAQAFARLGTKVTVVVTKDFIMPREDEDVSSCVQEAMVKEGVVFKTNCRATKVRKSDKGVVVTIEKKDGGSEEIEAQQFLIATGRRPNVGGMNLERAGVATYKNGVKVDKHLRTSTKNIYACGDINGNYLFTHVAAYESVTAILNAIYKVPQKVDYTNMPWCTFTDPQAASIGYNEKRAKEAGINFEVHKEFFEHNDRALAEGENNGFIKILLSKGKVIGVQIVSFHAGDLIAEWIPVLNGNRKIDAVGSPVHPYPTMAEMNKNAAISYQISKLPDTPKKILKAIFGYQGEV